MNAVLKPRSGPHSQRSVDKYTRCQEKKNVTTFNFQRVADSVVQLPSFQPCGIRAGFFWTWASPSAALPPTVPNKYEPIPHAT